MGGPDRVDEAVLGGDTAVGVTRTGLGIDFVEGLFIRVSWQVDEKNVEWTSLMKMNTLRR